MSLYLNYLTFDENGQPIDPMVAADRVKQLNKLWKDFEGAKTLEARKTAYLELLTLQNGVPVDQASYDKMWNDLVAEFGQQRIANLPADKLTKVFQIETQIEGLREAVRALNTMAAMAGMDTPEGRDYAARAAAVESQISGLQAERISTVRFGGAIERPSGGGGGGTPEKTLFQELKEQARASQAMFAQVSELGNQRGFNKFISGPFAPEFLEYLRSQGEKGLKLIKGGLDKVKQAYSNFIADRSAQMAAEAAIAPQLRKQEMDFMQEEVNMRRRLASEGRPQQEIDFIVENTMEKKKQIVANRQLIKETDRTTEAGKKRIQNLNEHNRALRLDIQDVERNAAAYIKLQKALEFAGMSMREIDMLIYQNSQTIKDLERRIEEFNAGGLIDLQGQIDAQQKIADGISRTIDLRQRDVDAISRTIELKERELEPLDKSIQAYEKQIDQIEEYYDIQLQALDDVANAEERLNDIREGRLDVASALSRGDVAGAARAAVEMRRRFAEQQQDATRQALEKRRQEEVDAIQANIKQTQEQRVRIEEEIEQLQLQQRDIQDEIYNLQQSMIPVQDEIYRLNVAITNEADRLDDKYRDAAAEVANLKNELAQARDRAIELAAARASAGAGGDGGGAAPAVNNAPASVPAGTSAGMAPVVQSYIDRGIPSGEFSIFAAATARRAMGGTIKKYAMGGMVNYKGSREPAPGFMMGGKIKKMAFGSFVPGRGMTDKVPAMLTPGEFVVRKPVAEKLGPMLQSLNSQVFPGMGVPQQRSMSVSAPQFDTMKRISSDNVRFGVPQSINSFTYPTTNMNITQSNTDMSPTNYNVGPTNVQYTYNLNISTETDASPDDIANTVMYRIKRFEDRRIKGTEIG
jgi:predicted  nucleic acid-binding Zn-ribbon protein